ncbi:MAG: flippase [Patescibacteria group bacterium]
MPISQQLAKNSAIQIIGKFLATIFGVITLGILTRYMGAAGYGQLTTILTFTAIFAIVVDLGLTLTTVQMIAEPEADEKTLLGNLMSLRLVSSIIFLSLAPLAAIFFPYESIIVIGIAIGAFSYIFGTSSQMLIGIFQKRLIMDRAIAAELINRLVVLLGAALAPSFGLGLLGIMWLFVLGNGLNLVIILYFARQQIRFRLQWQTQIIKSIIKRSWPIGASIFFNLIYLRGDILFMSIFRSDAEIGLYGAAYKVVDVITVVPVMFMGLVLPILISYFVSKRSDDFKKLLQQTFDFFAIFSIPIIFGSIATGVPLLEMISGSEFRESGEVLAILGPAAVVVFFNSLFGHAIVAVHKQKPMVLAYFAVAIITVIGYLIYIPQYGMWAAAWWTLISEILIGLISFIVVWRVSSFLPQVGQLLRALIASLIMYFVLMVMPEIQVLLQILFGAAVYAAVLIMIGGPQPKDIFNLFAKTEIGQ